MKKLSRFKDIKTAFIGAAVFEYLMRIYDVITRKLNKRRTHINDICNIIL